MDKGVKSSIPKPIPRITSQAVNGKKQSSYDPPSELRWALRKNDHPRTSAAEYHDFQRRLSSEQGMGSRESEQGQDTNHQSCVEGAQQKGDLQDGEEKSDYAESVSVRTAVRMFGGEAKIRKLPTPDRSLISSIDPESPDEEDAAGNSSSVMYPICGTISPLGRVKRSHSDDQISFVFGRPSISDSRRSVAKPAVKCRPSSPASDVIKRTYTKTSIGGTGFREKIRHQELTADQGLNNNNTMETFVVNTMKQNGVYCEQCNMCLADFERQALRLLYPDGPRGGVMIKTLNATEKIEEKLQVPANCQKLLKITHCEVCHASLKRLKKEAVAMVASNQQAPLETLSGIPSFIGTDYRSSKRGSATNDHTRNSRRHRIASQSTTSHVPIPTSCSEKYKDRPKPTILAQQQRKFDENDVRVFPHDVTTYSIGPSEQPQQYRNNADYYQSERKPLHADPYSVSANVPRHSLYAAQQLNPHANMQAMDPYQARVQCGHHDSHVSQGLPPPHGGQGPTPIHGGLGYNNAPNYYAMQYHYSMPGSNVHHAAAIEHPMYVKYGSPPPPLPGSPPPLSRVASPGSQHSAAASFFARAAQKMGKKKKRHHQQEPELPQFPTKYNEVIRVSPPPVPPCLLRAAGRLQQPGVGKVKVMLKICSHGNHGEQGQSCLSVDPRKKQVTVFDPSAIGITTSAHRRTPVAPKMFAFDAVFSPDDSQTEVCASSLTEIIQGVVGGADGCLFTYGYSRQGKSSTMLGSDNSAQTLGVLPCAISWLFRLINEQKEKTGARFSVRVSAVEVSGKNERLKDLLFDIAQTTECGQGTAPGVYLREDPICGTQLENQSELRAPTCERAAYYLDAALAARASDEEEGRSSHLLFTLHVYQYRIEKANQAGLPGVAGGRSRLHLIDLGSSSKSKDPDNVSLSLSALGNVIMALLNGQRHVPHRDSKVAQLLRDSLGNISCRTCMIAHVSSSVAHHNETLQVIQLAARIHRMRRRKTRFSSTSSDDSSTDDGRLRRPFPKFRMGTLREDALYTSAHSDPDFTSSSEQSCDTVIYVGANGQSLSDREITDNEGPPRSVPRTNPRLPRRPSGSRSSGDEGSNSDSGRSRSSSDFRYGRAALVNRDMYNVNRNLFPRGVSTSPRAGITSPRGVTTSPRVSGAVRDVSVVQSPPMSPSSVPRKIRTRAISNSQAEAEKSPRHTTKGEQWIDGPGATMYPETRTTGEQWIDGPQAFVVKQEVATTSENKHLYNPKMNAEEQWVDGPMEMIADKPREGRSTHAHGRADKRGSTHDFKTSHASRHQKAKSEQEKTTRDSTASVDSVSSMTAQGPDSRPASLHVDHKKEDESNESVKPFVRDWVEKHSAINEESVCENSNIGLFVNYGNQVIGTLESACRHKRQKAENTRKLSSSTQSPHQSPLQSPTSRRKVKTDNATSNLQKSQLPTSANPTKRVTEWLKSVSTEQIQPCRDSANDKNCDRCHSDDLSQGIEDINMAPCSSDGRPDEMAECHVGDISFDSSVDTNSEVTTNLVINRDSIYEMQMDEQLEETAEASNSVRDNDTFSNTSCQKENELSENEEPEDSRESSVPHSITVESIKTLVAEENQKIHLEQQYCDCKSCHVTDGENEKITPLAISKSFLLRKPDGASNPNLTNEFNYDGKLDVNFMRGEYIINNVHHVTTHNQEDYTVYKTPPGVHKTPEIVDNITTKAKPPLPNSRHLKSHSASPARTSKNKDISLSPKSTSSYSSRSSSIPVSSHTGRSKEKSIHPSGQSSVRSSSIPVTNSPSSSCTTRSTSSKSSKTSPASTRLPLFSGKALQTNKDVKARNKKDKESKLGNERIGMLTRSCSRGTDSDSGNDSGIVPGERKLLSPYCTVTKPRTPSHSSSGHGSDNSSTVSADLRSQLGVKDKLHGGTSSGYESMLRDSEGSGSSSAPDDSNSESSSDKRKTSKRRRSSTRRSKSVPARSSESPEHAGQCSGGKGTSPSPKAWVDTRQIQKIKEEPFEIKLYDVTDVERLQRRRAEEETKESKETRTERFNQSKVQDNNDSKENIVLENRNWSFDCKFLMCFCRSKNKRTDV